MSDLPVVVTKAGALPTDPAILRQRLLDIAIALDAGLTANLPGALIEDIASTDVGALTVMDSEMVDLINSITPYGANLFLLNQLGQIYGVQQGGGANGSVYVVFSGPAGFLIARGFTVSDGTHQYVVQDGGIIASGGDTDPLFCVATDAGTFAIPENTVTDLVTSVPDTITLTCNNPTDGTPAEAEQTEQAYRAQVIQAGLASAQGMASFLKTQLQKVSGVQQRLISVVQDGDYWQVIVGGGDPYQVAYAIYTGIFDINSIAGSSLEVTDITNADPGVITTNIYHGFTTGQVINITGVVGTSGINDTPLTITVIDDFNFSIGIVTTSSGSYTSGGVITPNLRNVSVSINDYPDTYVIPFIVPLQQSVAVTFLWDTISTNYVSPASVAALATPEIVAYINSIVTGQPINVFELQAVFQASVASILPAPLISRMAITVDIDGQTVSPTAGTGLIEGSAQSYFFTTTAAVVVSQG